MTSCIVLQYLKAKLVLSFASRGFLLVLAVLQPKLKADSETVRNVSEINKHQTLI
jgi:hypothetical protein